ncbi:MAG TPA: helix-turn-helix domain-containing protein [Casimicrobium huifangae]|uniref:TetR/AcrR family transcriptional regulator n=1 Tax=Casimicrobium huifangae TaxID=2591109 RepID=UPI0012EB83A7|nr:TetR/AcrR family transcriptional regulator [Casimicrobium huifangae]HOB00422.1 helix-turn-helix domain-containing protein [Casimicrobium huifangae]HQA32507.1 helix-turn-helix domain-containing protein [Casimicrobium huifangae]HQD64058.1 helix-turn-helix domain-containing protein [Casimicrobium huifangae]
MSLLKRISFKDQAFQQREDAILDAATRILTNRGFDLMTMDEVATDVGVSKPSLYKHFKSKEELAGECMIRLLDGANETLAALPDDLPALERIRRLLGWALDLRLKGGLPFLPATSPHVRDMLVKNLGYTMRALKLNNALVKLVRDAQKTGQMRKDLPEDVILYSFYARTCDPSVEFLRLYSKLSNAEIVEHTLSVYFGGVGAKP